MGCRDVRRCRTREGSEQFCPVCDTFLGWHDPEPDGPVGAAEAAAAPERRRRRTPPGPPTPPPTAAAAAAAGADRVRPRRSVGDHRDRGLADVPGTFPLVIRNGSTIVDSYEVVVLDPPRGSAQARRHQPAARRVATGAAHPRRAARGPGGRPARRRGRRCAPRSTRRGGRGAADRRRAPVGPAGGCWPTPRWSGSTTSTGARSGCVWTTGRPTTRALPAGGVGPRGRRRARLRAAFVGVPAGGGRRDGAVRRSAARARDGGDPPAERDRHRRGRARSASR